MPDIIELSDHWPHIAGEVKCNNCKYTWAAVSPIKEEQPPCDLECPECGLNAGFYRYPVYPKDGTVFWVCTCGGELFQIIEEGAWCIKCGKVKLNDNKTI